MAYTPIVIASIALTATHRVASRDYYDASNNFYKGTLLNFPDLTEQLPDLYYGVENSQSVTLELANPIDAGPDDNWYTISEAEELRGAWVTLGLYDPDDGTTTLLTGKVSKYELAETFKLTVEMRNDPILDTLLPKDLVTVDTFTATAQDIGQPINICFGRCKDVPLRNIQNDTTGEIYDYLIGYGPIEGLYTSAGFGIKREGVLVNPPEYTLYDGTQASPYPGFAFIRFTTEQTDTSGRFYHITADIHGLVLDNALGVRERNFSLVIQSILSNSVFGLDDDCDATSFSDAVTILDVYYRCDGAITKQRAARDILNDMLFPARNAYIFRGTDGEWEISVPTTGASVATFGENDGYYNNCKITSISVPDTAQALRKVIIQYDFDMSGTPRATLESQIHSTFGIDKTYTFKFVQGGYTAHKIASYFYQRALYEGTLSLECGLEARALRRGDIITVVSNDKPPLTSGKEYIVESVNRIIQVSGNTANLYRVTGREYDSDLYGDVTLPDKTEFVPGANTVNGPVSLIGDLKLGDGDTNPGTITLQVAPGEGDTAIKIGKTDFDNTETGVIMGIDDSDSDTPKLYLGNISKYLNWDGTDFVIKAGNFEIDADGNLWAENADIEGIITASTGSIGGFSITSTMIAGTGIEIDSANKRIRVYNGSNYVEMSQSGLIGYSSLLGETFNIPIDGSAPTFSAGVIKDVEHQLWNTGVISTAETGRRIQINKNGIQFISGAVTGKYSSFKWGDGTVYGTGLIMNLHNEVDKVPIEVLSAQNVADFHFVDRPSDPSGGAKIGDCAVVNGVLKSCVSAGSPGTWEAVGGGGFEDILLFGGM